MIEASAIARITVKIVPSFGFVTALYATFAPSIKAFAKSIALGAADTGITETVFMDIDEEKLYIYGKIAKRISQMINPDAIEIMPGIMPRITKQLSTSLEVPVIVGGLISEEEEIKNALSNGALGVSTSCKSLWGFKK